MANGIPLTDDDRWDWLETLRNKAVDELQAGAEGCVVTCSCLKRRYRDVIRLAGREADDVVVRFVYLRASEELLLKRVKARKNHYMKDSMVHSQFTALEEPDETEIDVVSVDVSGSLSGVQSLALEKVQECMESEKQ
jgi:gluconokinase